MSTATRFCWLLLGPAAVVLLLNAVYVSAHQAASRPSTAPFAPRDWVVAPLVDESERAAPHKRIVSAAPNLTEICCALGLRDQLVGRTRYCTYPPGIESLPALGALVDINVEALVTLKPDLVLVSGASRAITERLQPLGLCYESVPDTSLSDLFAAIRRVGELTGRRRTAEALCRAVQRDFDEAAARYRGAPPASVLIVTGVLSDPPAPPFVAGPGSFYDEFLRRAGHRNAVASEGRAFGPLSLEFILKADPDVIIELDPDGRARPGGDEEARRAWGRIGALKAVRTGRVHVLVGGAHYLLGPRSAQTFAELSRVIASGGK